MNNIYKESIQAVEDGANFKVDFQSRSLKVNGKYVIRNGEYEGELGVPDCSEDVFSQMWKNSICATSIRFLHNVARVNPDCISGHSPRRT